MQQEIFLTAVIFIATWTVDEASYARDRATVGFMFRFLFAVTDLTGTAAKWSRSFLAYSQPIRGESGVS